MEMQLSGIMMERIRADLAANPLAENEIRRVEDMGDLYLALATTQVDGGEYLILYTIQVDDKIYNFYSPRGSHGG